MTSLHLSYNTTSVIATNLAEWTAAIGDEGAIGRDSWAFTAFWPAASSASTSASTGIEGNPLTPEQVDAVTSGDTIDADEEHLREVRNYDAAMDFAHRASSMGDMRWGHGVIREINALVMQGLSEDTRGEYRSIDVHVGIFSPPSERLVSRYMDDLVAWLGRAEDHALIRSALLHLNVIAIHPFRDGNGRSARILSALELMRAGVSGPELVSIEPYLRRNREEYFEMLRLTLGERYDPEQQQATEWLEYYTRISVERLTLRNRLRDSIPSDIGHITLGLAERAEPAGWGPLLLAAAIRPLRTREVAGWTGRTSAAARATLGRMARAGWISPLGRTRSRRYIAGPRLSALPLSSPGISAQLRSGEAATGDTPESTSG